MNRVPTQNLGRGREVGVDGIHDLKERARRSAFAPPGRILVAGIVLSVGTLLILPVEIPYSITLPGKVLSARDLNVTLNSDGSIVSSLVDHASGLTTEYAAAQFNRGDAVRFVINRGIGIGVTVQAGDTLGRVRSSEVELELARLRGELANAAASLASTVAGEKKSIVDEARQTVLHERKEAEVLAAVLARQKQLFEKKLISKEEYELAEGRAAVANVEVSMAEARLQSAIVGSKVEEQALAAERVRGIQREIGVLEHRQQEFTIISPVSGVLAQTGSRDTLLVVVDTTSFVVAIPVPLRERAYVTKKQTVLLSSAEMELVPSAELTAIGRTVHLLNGQQVVLAIAQCGPGAGASPHGLVVLCSINCRPVTPVEYVRRFFRGFLRR